MQQPLNILTLATGKKLYLDMAVNLIRSFIWWNKDTRIDFYLATDMPQYLPVDVKDYVKIIALTPNELGKGFSPKLHLDKIAPVGQTLFIDSDCLIFGNLLPVFEKFKKHKVSVVGNYISNGEWFGDIAAICKKMQLSHIPKFNGGIYYLENGPEAAAVYNTARELEPQYDEIGFIRLRNRPNDEVLIALAMQLHKQTPIIDDGTIMSDPQACRGDYKVNVITGKRLLINPPAPHALHQSWYPFIKVKPLVVHFLGDYTKHYPYRRETYRLRGNMGLIGTIVGIMIIEYPARFAIFFKNTFRTVYHKLLGVRKVKQSERVIT